MIGIVGNASSLEKGNSTVLVNHSYDKFVVFTEELFEVAVGDRLILANGKNSGSLEEG